MKPTTLLFIITVILMGVKFFRIVIISNWIIFGAVVLWFLAFYIQTHNRNKERNTPRAVYLSSPSQ